MLWFQILSKFSRRFFLKMKTVLRNIFFGAFFFGSRIFYFFVSCAQKFFWGSFHVKNYFSLVSFVWRKYFSRIFSSSEILLEKFLLQILVLSFYIWFLSQSWFFFYFKPIDTSTLKTGKMTLKRPNILSYFVGAKMLKSVFKNISLFIIKPGSNNLPCSKG